MTMSDYPTLQNKAISVFVRSTTATVMFYRKVCSAEHPVTYMLAIDYLAAASEDDRTTVLYVA